LNRNVRGDAHSNTVEGYFLVLKRGITAPNITSARRI